MTNMTQLNMANMTQYMDEKESGGYETYDEWADAQDLYAYEIAKQEAQEAGEWEWVFTTVDGLLCWSCNNCELAGEPHLECLETSQL